MVEAFVILYAKREIKWKYQPPSHLSHYINNLILHQPCTFLDVNHMYYRLVFFYSWYLKILGYVQLHALRMTCSCSYPYAHAHGPYNEIWQVKQFMHIQYVINEWSCDCFRNQEHLFSRVFKIIQHLCVIIRLPHVYHFVKN
jgi:hypothetical protein